MADLSFRSTGVESFIDTVGTPDNFRRGGTLGPTVRLVIDGDTTVVDRNYGVAGLGGYADIPTNKVQELPGKQGVVPPPTP
jgi:levansucrase